MRTEFVFMVLSLVLVGIIIGASTAPPRIIRGVESIMFEGERQIEMIVPAVDTKDSGVVGTLITTVRPGSGRVLVSINDVLAQFDTQLSGRIAAQAAGDFTEIDMSTIDVIYEIDVNATTIEGPSAGASMATSITLALLEIEPDPNIAITGIILEDGRIGKVGSISEKARAARDAGATIFVIPDGQATEEGAVREEECSSIGSITRCSITYRTKTVNIGEELEMIIVEATDLGEIIGIYKKGITTQ